VCLANTGHHVKATYRFHRISGSESWSADGFQADVLLIFLSDRLANMVLKLRTCKHFCFPSLTFWGIPRAWHGPKASRA
jgi:hypothetical protein